MSAYQYYEKCQSSNGCTATKWGDCVDNIFVEIKDFDNAVFLACEAIAQFNPFQEVTCNKKNVKLVFEKKSNGYFITMPHNGIELYNNTLIFSIDGKD